MYLSSGCIGEEFLDGREDTDLVEAARKGEVAAYEQLVLRYQTIAFRTAWLLTGDPSDAEEATQEAFLKAWRTLDRFDANRGIRAIGRWSVDHAGAAQSAFRPWLLTIVANEARNRRRSRIRRPELTLEPAIFDVPDKEASPELIAERREQQVVLLAAMAELSERDRLSLELRYFLELNESEMAAVLGVARGTVKSRLSRAIGRLRLVLDPATSQEQEEHA